MWNGYSKKRIQEIKWSSSDFTSSVFKICNGYWICMFVSFCLPTTSWHVSQVLEALGYTHLSPQHQAHLHTSYASQLEALGLWHWAAFILLHTPHDLAREHLLRSLLSRHVTLETTGDLLTQRERFLVERLRVPVEWIHHAKAVRALYEGRERDEAWHLLRAGCWNDCHTVLIKKIAADAIINGEMSGSCLPGPLTAYVISVSSRMQYSGTSL